MATRGQLYLAALNAEMDKTQEDRAEAEQIRQDAKAVGTWGKTQEEVGAILPELNATSSNAANNKKASTTTSDQKKTADDVERTKLVLRKAASKKAYDDYTQSAEYKTKAVERENQKTRYRLLSGIMDVPMPEEADEKEQQLKAEADYWQSQYEAEENQRIRDADMKEIESWSDEDRAALEEYVRGRDVRDDPLTVSNPLRYIFQTHKAAKPYAALAEKYGEERLKELAESYSRVLHEQDAQKVVEDTAAAVDTVPGAVGHNILSVGANGIGGVLGTLGRVNEAFNRTGRYQTLEAYTPGDTLNLYASTVRGATAQNIENSGELGWLGNLAYQGAMSTADSLARAATGSVGNMALAAASSFSQNVSEASRRGATPGQAVALGLTNAAVEAVSEKLPFDELLNIAKGGKQTFKQALVTALKQMGIEATTEEISLVGSILAEAAILREKSGYNQQIISAFVNGTPLEEARKQANKDLLIEAAKTAAVSAISGGLSSAGASVVANMRTVPETTQPKMTEAEKIQQRIMDITNPSKEAAGDTQKPQTEQQAPEPVKTPEQEQQEAWEEVLSVTRPQQVDNAVTAEEAAAVQNERAASLDDADAPPPAADKYQGESNDNTVDDPFRGRDWNEVGKKNVKAYMYENPEVKPYFQMEAQNMLMELSDSIRGERFYNEDVAYATGGEKGYTGVKRNTSDGIAELLDSGFTYDQIERGLNAIIQDNGAENNALSKRIEFVLNDRLLNGHKDFYSNDRVPASDEYIKLVNEKQITEYSKEAFDALVESGDKYVPPASDSERAPQMDTVKQSVEGGQPKIKGTGAAEQNFTGTAAYDDLLSDDNVQRSRKGDVRNVEVPKTDTDGKVVSEFVSNSMNSALTPDRFTDTIKKLVVDGKVSHDVQSNEESLRMAAAEIAKDGTIYSSVQKVKEVAKSGKTSVTDVAKAELLYNHLVQQEDQHSQEMAADVYVTLAQLATNSGRSTQMFSLFRKMTPDGQVMALEQEVKRNVEQMKKQGKVKKDYDPQIHPEVLAEYRKAAVANKNAKTPEAQQETAEQLSLWQDAIYANEAAKMPATFKAKWDAWRYMAMLGNVKTQARNIVGNLAFKPYKAVKDTMAAGFERVFIKQDQRTKSVLTLSANDRALTEWAKADTKSKDVQNALKYSAKLGDDVTSSVMSDNQTVFKSKALEETRKFIEKVPAAGDMLFKNGYYEKSMAGFLKARGYTAADIQNGNVSDTVLNEGRAYAIQEAMKATFNDCNAFSDAVASIGRASGIIHKDNAWSKALNIAAEGVLPFRRTPANIVVRFTEYSPVGLAKGVWDAATKIRSGQISAAAAVDQLAAGMTGTAAMALGFMLAKGIGGVKITGSGTDEDEKRQGHQDYAVEFSIDGQEYSYKIDWAAPANLPLFVGANIYSALENAGADTDVSKLTSFIHGMGTMFEPMLALSCMSSLNDLVEGVRYADEGEALYTMASQMATSYFTQGIPALARQTAQALQENKQATFANSEDPTIRDLQKTAAGIPGVGSNFQTDKVNAWGEKESNGNGFWRWFNAFVNPGTGKKIDNSALEQEINRLNEAQTESVTPPTASKTITFTDKDGNVHDGERLTEEQYQTLATTQGQTAKRILETMFSSKDYAAMTDEQKAKAVNQVYDYAKEKGYLEAIEGYPDMKGWKIGIDGKEADTIIRKVAADSLASALSDIGNAWTEGWSTEQYNKILETAYSAFEKMGRQTQNAILKDASTNVRNYIEARQAGIPQEKYLDVTKKVIDIKPETGYVNANQKQMAETVTRFPGLTKEQEKLVLKMYMSDAQDQNIDDLAEMGYDCDDFATLLRDYSDYTSGRGKKNRTVSKWMKDYDIDYAAAKALYEIFSG